MAAALVVVLLPACDPPVRLELVVTDPGIGADAAIGDGVCEATPGDGDCTLRAAIEEANAEPSADVITVAAGVTPLPGGAVPITDSLEIRGGGTTLAERLVHEVGALVVKDLSIVGVTGATTCGGAIASDGTSVVLDHVVLRANATTALTGGGVCAAGKVVVIDSTLTENLVSGALAAGAGVAAHGDIVVARSRLQSNRRDTGQGVSQVASLGSARLEILHSTLVSFGTSQVVHAVGASGRIVASRVEGTSFLNAAITVAASRMGPCAAGVRPTSGGHNLFADASCAAVATDRVAANAGFAWDGVPEAWSPLVDAIPAGTPGLCPGPLPTDQSGGERPLFGACDIGPLEHRGRVRATAPTGVGTAGGSSGPWAVAAINDAGATVGTTLTIGSTWQYRATRWAPDGTPTFVAPVGSSAAGIGPDGTVVGSWTTAMGRPHAFAWVPATQSLVDLGTLPGDTSAEALDVDAGWVVGISRGPAGPRPWAASEATGMVALPTLGGTTGAAVAVNGSGLAVGWSTTATGASRAALWDLAAGTVADLGVGAAPHGSSAVDIDDDGVVIGTVSRPDLGEDCYVPDYGTAACPFSQPFRWDPATGELTQVEGLLGPVSAAAFGPDGTILESVFRPELQCAGCPNYTRVSYLYDPVDGSHTRIAASSFLGVVDANASGVVVANDTYGTGPGSFYPVPSKLSVTLAG